jgi:hypothetical protein
MTLVLLVFDVGTATYRRDNALGQRVIQPMVLGSSDWHR